MEKVKLYKHNGCVGCSKKCQFNGLTATEEVAKADKIRFDCNSSMERKS